ncbi:hypothetical protein AABB24_036793 [Solanum stoloniferum]|uniref:E3 ubiquitin-protein ligase RMA n=1 Tax=Solanum stoloniferum TaxID=62892 RepID=A0ABD2R4E8_9SOLN
MALDLHLQQANRRRYALREVEDEGGYPSRGFECNICLDLANDPVVTFCGHLYCWPCIYKWIHLHSIPSEHHPQCPVCKADVSERTWFHFMAVTKLQKHLKMKFKLMVWSYQKDLGFTLLIHIHLNNSIVEVIHISQIQPGLVARQQICYIP